MIAIRKRLKNSLIGMVVGLALIPASVALHSWNEYRTIHRSRGLAEAASLVVSIENANSISQELDGHLVHLAGKADTEERLRDEVFGVRAHAIHLARRVEMYQWDEHEDKDDEDHVSYSHSLSWSKDRIDSSHFHEPTGHENPPLQYQSTSSSASKVNIGVYELSHELRDAMRNWAPIQLNEASIREALGPEPSKRILVQENQLYWSQAFPNPKSPVLGDLRIRFEQVDPAEVSLIAKQKGATFSVFKTSNGESIEKIYMGILSAEEVVKNLMIENTMIAWLLRCLGLFLCFSGFSLASGPLRGLFSWIPLLGSVTGLAFLVVSFLLATIVSLTTISIAWIAVRPLLGIALLGIAAVAGYLIAQVRSSTQSQPISEYK